MRKSTHILLESSKPGQIFQSLSEYPGFPREIRRKVRQAKPDDYSGHKIVDILVGLDRFQ